MYICIIFVWRSDTKFSHFTPRQSKLRAHTSQENKLKILKYYGKNQIALSFLNLSSHNFAWAVWLSTKWKSIYFLYTCCKNRNCFTHRKNTFATNVFHTLLRGYWLLNIVIELHSTELILFRGWDGSDQTGLKLQMNCKSSKILTFWFKNCALSVLLVFLHFRNHIIIWVYDQATVPSCVRMH